MSTDLNTLKTLVLDLFSTERQPDAARVASLDEADWKAVQRMIRQHRLGPMMHWRQQQAATPLPIPQDVRAVWAESYRASAMRSLQIQRHMILLHDYFEQAGIPALFMKGAYLAFFVYPQAALRPLRDIDVLVPAERVKEAYEGLRRVGWSGINIDGIDKQDANHLPPIHSPDGTIALELHYKITCEHYLQSNDTDIPSADLFARSVRKIISSRNIAFFGTADQLLHLIVHAVYGHRLDNGPLTFADINYFCKNEAVDWTLFWQLADERQCTNGCALALSATQQLFGDLKGINQITPVIGATTSALHLSLRDLSKRKNSLFIMSFAQKRRKRNRTLAWLRYIFPAPDTIRRMYGSDMTGVRISLLYLHRLNRLIMRLFMLSNSFERQSAQCEAEQILQMDNWLLAVSDKKQSS